MCLLPWGIVPAARRHILFTTAFAGMNSNLVKAIQMNVALAGFPESWEAAKRRELMTAENFDTEAIYDALVCYHICQITR